MARQAGEFIENQFTKGLITEATGLNFPEKAVIESWNTRYGKTGETTRRLGVLLFGGTLVTQTAPSLSYRLATASHSFVSTTLVF
jgi:hypothetical protein